MPEPAHKGSSGAGADGIGKRKLSSNRWTTFGSVSASVRWLSLKIGRAGALLADKTAAGRTDRLSVARAAQLEAIARHAIKPLPVLADPDDDRHVDRSEAQDLHAWND